MYFCYPFRGPGLKEHSVEYFHLECFEKCENFITTTILIVDVVSRHYQYALKVVGRYAATV